MIQFDRFIMRNEKFSAMKMQSVIAAGVKSAMQNGTRAEWLRVDGEYMRVSYAPASIPGEIAVTVSRHEKTVCEARYLA